MRSSALLTAHRWRGLLLWLGCLLPMAGTVAQGAEENRTVRVAANSDTYPYSFVDERGAPDGFSKDVLDAVANAIGLTVERTSLPSREVQQRFRAGEFDIVQTYAADLQRDRDILVTTPYLVLHGAIFVRKGDNRFGSLDDLRATGARVAATSQGHRYAEAQGLDAAQLQRTTSEGALRALVDGEVDAVLLTRLTGNAEARRLGLRDRVETMPSVLSGFSARYCFAVPASEPELHAQLSEGLAVLYQSNDYGRIYEKWFARYEPARFSREKIAPVVATSLAILLAFVIWAWQRQRQLRTRIARQAEQLAESRSLLAEAQQLARLGHWQQRFEPRASLEWSEETYRVFERDPALGPPGVEELTSWAGDVEDRALWRAMISRAEKSGRPYDLDLVVEPKPGTRKTIHVRGRPVFDAAGNAAGLFGTVQDVTAWRTAEAALRQSEQVLRALYANLPHALGVVEYAGGAWRVVSLNSEALRLLALPAEPAAGTPLVELGLVPDRLRLWTGLFVRSVAHSTACKTEMRSDDGRRNFAVTVVPLGYVAGNARSCFLVEDITERKQKDAELAQSRRLRAIGELVGGIAHEFNNLLTPILLKADLLQMQRGHDPALLAELRVITEAARRSAELTRRLLTFGRKSDARPEWVEVRTLVDGVLELVRHTIDRRIRIECHLPARLPKLHLVPGDLHQILINLLLNARDTLMDKLARPLTSSLSWAPQISIEAQVLPSDAVEPPAPAPSGPVVENWLRLTVRDDGLGMPPAVLERIFEPFYTTKQVGQGTGLGLATVWHLVTDLGGRVDVESAAGEGSAFHVNLPVHAPVTEPAPAPPAKVRGAPPAVTPRRVLLVEDEEIIARLVLAVLRHHGHAVTLASNGQEGWQQLSASGAAFDTVLMDLNMPGLNGLELARRARALPYAGRLIVMSGHVSEDERAELKRLGIAAILPKPFKLEELLAVLADLELAPGSARGAGG